MPISGKNKIDRFKVARLMVEPKEEFSIGEVFLYKPIGSDTIMRLEVIDCSNVVSGVFVVEDCKNHCAVEPWCCKDGNCKEFRIPGTTRIRKEWFIPQCHVFRRNDSKDVYFEEV